MKTIYLKKSTACLFFLAYLAIASVCFATYEVETVVPDAPANGVAQQQTTDFSVDWVAPTITAPDQLMNFAYVWNNSSTLLTDDPNFVYSESNFTANSPTDTQATLSSQEIASDDSDDLRYLHLLTVYLDNSNGTVVRTSSDVVIGPFNFDNVCTGTFRLPDPDNTANDLVSTRATTVDIEVGAPVDISSTGLYLNEIDTIPTTGINPATTTTHTLQNTTPGSKTIYAWFEDEVGNISSAFPASFTLLDPVSIDPYTADIDLSGQDTKIFTVAGDAGTYDWAIENETPDDGSGTVVQFSGANTGVNSVTVQALEKGTFTLRASPNAGGSDLTSGILSVIGSAVNLDADGDGQVLFNTDGFLIFRYLANFPTFYGDSWINGVVSGTATRSTATDIGTYLGQGVANLVFDVDGDGQVLFNTDGFLIFRYLANFPTFYGASWINGVVSGTATRSTATDIETYINSILP